MQGLHVAEPWAANTTNAALLTPAWQLLLARIGDELMLHLLQHTSIFLPIGGCNVLQATGRPVTEVRRICCMLHAPTYASQGLNVLLADARLKLRANT